MSIMMSIEINFLSKIDLNAPILSNIKPSLFKIRLPKVFDFQKEDWISFKKDFLVLIL